MGTNARDVAPFAQSIAAELRAEQARQHIGLRALAELAGMPHSTLSKSLNGLRMIDVEELAKICAALHIEPSTIWQRATSTLSRSTVNVVPSSDTDVLAEIPVLSREASKKANLSLAAQQRQRAKDAKSDDEHA